MSFKDELNAMIPTRKHSKEEDPHVLIEDNARGEATSKVYEENGDNLTEKDLLEGWKLDPNAWRIIPGTLAVNRWVQNAEEDTWCYQYKAKIDRPGAVAELFEGLPTVEGRPQYLCMTCRTRFDNTRVGTLWCSAKCRDTILPDPGDFGIVRHVVIPDTQVTPNVPTDHLVWAGRYIRDHCKGERTRISMIGDHWDMESLSSYDQGKRAAEGRRVRADFEAGNRAFEVLNESMGDDPLWDKHFFFGNHEDRITRYVDDHAELEEFLSLDNCITPTEWERHEYLQPVWLDGVAYSHYFYHPNTGRAYSGENMEARIKQVGHSFVMGHQQGLKMGMHYAAGKQRFGLVAGSYYQHDEDYKGPQGNAHWRGIVVLNNVEGGSFDPMPVDIDYLCREYEGHRFVDHKGVIL